MDAHQFDRLTAAFVGTRNRRRLLALLTTLPITAHLHALVGEEAQAARPVRRVQGRQDEQREHARHRKEHRHEVKTRDNGKKKRAGAGSGGGSRGCPDKVVTCCVLEKDAGHSGRSHCTRDAGKIGPVGTCWDWGDQACLPCRERSGEAWRKRCSETFPECAAAPQGCSGEINGAII